MATIYTVSTSDELYEALAKAQGGDEIRLASGDYGELKLWEHSGFDVTFDSPVTITSADPDAPASFSGMGLNGVANLTFDNIVFDYTYDASHATFHKPFRITESENITITNSVFDGDLATDRSEKEDGLGFAQGLNISASSGIEISDTEFFHWHRAMVFGRTDDIVVTGNEIHNIRSDGMDFAQAQNVLIADNYIHDFHFAEGDHADMIQFWTSGTDAPSTDVIIRNNILDVGEGDETQSIFIRNEVVDSLGGGTDMYYQNFLIEENVILNGHLHGITVGETNGLVIQNNTLLSTDPDGDQYFAAPRINLKEVSTSVTVVNNVAADISGYGTGDDVVVKNNAYVQNTDPTGVGYYGSLFLESTMGGPVANYVIEPGSMLDALNAGASLLMPQTSAASLSPLFDVSTQDGVTQTLVFDASYTLNAAGFVAAEDASFVWDFGDGTLGEGIVGSHKYENAGRYDVSLTVTTKEGEVKTVSTQVAIAGEDVLSFDAATGSFVTHGYGESSVVAESDAASVSGGDGHVIDLGASGAVLKLSNQTMDRFFSSDSFEMSLTIQADQPGLSWGDVARVHGSVVIAVREDGTLLVTVSSASGNTHKLVSGDLVVNDGTAHDITLRLDDDTDTLSLVVDGTVVDAAAMFDAMSDMGSWGLTFGNPWGKQNFDGKVSAFDLDASKADYTVYSGTAAPFETTESPEGETTLPPEFSEPVEPVTEPTAPTAEETSVEQESTSTETHDDQITLSELDDYIFDTATLDANQIKGDAQILGTEDDSYVQLNGGKDYIKIGRLEEFEAADELSFDVTFSKENATDSGMRLVWNHTHIGLAVMEDGLKLFVDSVDKAFHKGINIDDLGLDDTELHEARVIVDSSTDRIQVLLDDKLVYEEIGQRDIELAQGDGRQWGWTLGSAWKSDYVGEVHDFRIEANADFVPAVDDGSLLA